MPAALKNLISPVFLKTLTDKVLKSDPDFDVGRFNQVLKSDNLFDLELKDRVRKISVALGSCLSGPYERQLETILKVAAEVQGLPGMIFPDFIQVHGQQDWRLSVPALKKMTQYFSAEFAIRPFIVSDPGRTMKEMLIWSKDQNPHVRRLASEGCRPRLPWSFQLTQIVVDPTPVLAILENLKSDNSLYVRKSVANNLNDISKDHPKIVLALAQKWIGKNKHTDWILKHGLRTLLKKGDPQALRLFGVADSKKVAVKHLKTTRSSFQIGKSINFEFHIVNQSSARLLRIEYAIEYVKKQGRISKKVFKISEREFAKGSHVILRKHSLRQMTTRTHYPGIHRLEILVNGASKATCQFKVVR